MVFNAQFVIVGGSLYGVDRAADLKGSFNLNKTQNSSGRMHLNPNVSHTAPPTENTSIHTISNKTIMPRENNQIDKNVQSVTIYQHKRG